MSELAASPSSAAAAARAQAAPDRLLDDQAAALPLLGYISAGHPAGVRLRPPTMGELAYLEKLGMVVVLAAVLVWLVHRAAAVGIGKAGGELAGGMVP